MNAQLDIDPALFGVWPREFVYNGLPAAHDEALAVKAWQVLLDIKAETVSPLDDLHDMLNGMTKELRMQLQQFQSLREQAADRALDPVDDVNRKQTQADAKASIEAMSLIVRTLEKIDSLQRTIAHDRQAAADSAFDDEKYRAFAAEIDDRIERRARAIASRRLGSGSERTEGGDCVDACGDGGCAATPTGPPDPAYDGGGDRDAERNKPRI